MTYPTPKEITAMNLAELRKLAGSLNVAGASKMNKVTVTGAITAAITAAKDADKARREADKAAKTEQAAQATARIAELEAEMAETRNAATVNLERLAAEFVAIYPYAPWKAREMTPADYFTSQGVSKDEDTLTFPTVIRRAIAIAVWAGSDMPDAVPANVREMALRMLGSDDAPAVSPDAPVTHVVAMTGSSTPTIARDRAALGLASETRSAGNTGKHNSSDDDGNPPAVAEASTGTRTQAVSIPEMLDAMDLTELRMLATLVSEKIRQREAEAKTAA